MTPLKPQKLLLIAGSSEPHNRKAVSNGRQNRTGRTGPFRTTGRQRSAAENPVPCSAEGLAKSGGRMELNRSYQMRKGASVATAAVTRRLLVRASVTSIQHNPPYSYC